VTALLGATADQEAIARAARRRGIGLSTLADYRAATDGPAALILGYSSMSEARIRSGVAELASVIDHA